MVTVTKKDLVALGYGNSFATDIIRLAKIRMVEKGYPFYSCQFCMPLVALLKKE